MQGYGAFFPTAQANSGTGRSLKLTVPYYALQGKPLKP